MHKVDVPNSITYLNQKPIFYRYVVKNGYQKDISLNDIGLCAQNLLFILGSICNIIGGKPI